MQNYIEFVAANYHTGVAIVAVVFGIVIGIIAKFDSWFEPGWYIVLGTLATILWPISIPLISIALVIAIIAFCIDLFF